LAGQSQAAFLGHGHKNRASDANQDHSMSLGLLEYYIRFFVLVKTVRQDNDHVVVRVSRPPFIKPYAENGQCAVRRIQRKEMWCLWNLKSQSSKPNISSAEPKSSPPRQVSASAWRGSGKTVTIDELIEDQRRYLNSIDLCMLSAFSSRLRDKLKGTNADEYPGLRKAVDLIAQVLESPVAQQASDPLNLT
jgi:hypothetical protein